MQQLDAILIAGPTASGKTNHALDLADRYGGEIVNTDSMQIYPVLRILTARPDDNELARAAHHLYGHADITQPYSVARWMQDVKPTVSGIRERGKIPIFVGGTGLYFRALLEGLSPVPDIPEGIRRQVRGELEELGSHNLHLKLQKYDNEAAQRLNPGDSHRISRALEVVLATGTPLAEHHARDKGEPYLSGQNLEKILILPERARLIDRINERAEMMLKGGAIEEVESLLALALPPDATVLKAIGVPQISSYIIDSIDKNELCSNLQAATRQYAKRQSTWFRNQFEESWRRIG